MKKGIKEKTVKDYKSLDDCFVDKYLRYDDESIEQAKERIKKEHEETKIKKDK